MLVTDIGDEMCWWHFKMLVTILAIWVTNIHFLFRSRHQDSFVTSIRKLSPSSSQQHRDVTNIPVTDSCDDTVNGLCKNRSSTWFNLSLWCLPNPRVLLKSKNGKNNFILGFYLWFLQIYLSSNHKGFTLLISWSLFLSVQKIRVLIKNL